MKEFKVGDHVVYNQNFGNRTKGEKGVVITLLGDTVEVKHERPNNIGNYISVPYRWRLDLVAKPEVAVVPTTVTVSQPNAIAMVVESADRIFPRRSYDTILKSLMEEMGELSTEIAIQQGTKKRAASPDGVKGEAVDVFVVAVDMLRAAWGEDLFTQEFTDKVASKLAKWERV
jgi:NTP pyrophosphatase (non-canonical NTP hydrolase)